MGRLTVYCDDSGTGSGNKVAVVAGYLGSTSQWSHFCSEWSAALAREHIKIAHRVDLETFRGEFTEATGWTPDRRTAFVKALHAIIKHRTYTSVACAVIKKDFENVMPKWIQKLFGGPYGWCAHDCIVGIRHWCDDHPRDGDLIEWVFEAGTKGSGQVAAMLDSVYYTSNDRALYRLRGWTFAGKEVLPLQAADLVAYEVYKHMDNRVIATPKRKIRESAKDLFRQHEYHYQHYWDAPRLENWLARWDDKTKAVAALRPKEFQ